MSLERSSVSIERVLRRIEVAQTPSIKELPHFGEFVKTTNKIPKILKRNAEHSSVSTALETENFTLHDVRGSATLLAGMQHIRGTGPVWDKYVKLVDFMSGRRNANRSYADQIRSYEELATFIRNHDNELTLTHLGEEQSALFSGTRNAISLIAKVWPMIHYSSLMVDAAVNKKKYDHVNQWRHELIRHPLTVKDIVNVAVRRTCTNLDDSALLQKVDGVRGMMLFNVLKRISSAGNTNVRVIPLRHGGFTIFADTRGVTGNERQFSAEVGRNGEAMYGLFTVKELHGKLAGMDITYKDDSHFVDGPPYHIQYNIVPLDEGDHQLISSIDHHSGAKVYRSNYDAAIRMKDGTQQGYKDWRDFIFHEVSTPASQYAYFTAISTSTVTDNIRALEQAQIQNPKVDPVNVVYAAQKKSPLGELNYLYKEEEQLIKKIALLESMTQAELNDNIGFPKSFLEDARKNLAHFRHLFPLFKSSMQFLIDPNEDSFVAMKYMQVPSRDVLRYFGETQTTGVENRMLNGFEAISLFNFVKNAVTYSPRRPVERHGTTIDVPDTSAITIDFEQNGDFTVWNNSNDDPPPKDKLFTLRGKGQGGNTGFGLFTVGKLYAPLTGSEAEAEWKEQNNPDGTKYRVRFSLKKAS